MRKARPVPVALDVQSLPWCSLADVDTLPPCPALYFVMEADNTIVYIGRTIALHTRWKDHHRRQAYAMMPGLKIAWLAVSDRTLLPALETACIAFFQPRDNQRLLRTVPTALGKAIQTARVEKAMSQQALGLVTGIPYRHLSAIERGEINPRWDTVVKLALALDLHLDMVAWETDREAHGLEGRAAWTT